ncbi:helix-turn-helix domain-containing protein [Gemmatimonas sp.]|uniref:helix-turn-helix domain-containing protein n=1 Tax=Gemmatimonas sp. TaxID=1962908 RepID=UPI00286E8DE4|nr:helix-turn-helix domain-containing protein [Gemmatimonas sp.]
MEQLTQHDERSAPFLTAVDAARFLGLSVRTLNNWRWLGGGRGPEFHRIGTAIRYRRSDLEAWLSKRRFHSTSEADQRVAA